MFDVFVLLPFGSSRTNLQTKVRDLTDFFDPIIENWISFFLQIFVRKTVLAPDIVKEGPKIRIASLPFEQSAQHQNMAQCSIVSEGENTFQFNQSPIHWISQFLSFQRRGPQRSVDVIVSAAFILTLLLLAFLSVEWLKVFKTPASGSVVFHSYSTFDLFRIQCNCNRNTIWKLWFGRVHWAVSSYDSWHWARRSIANIAVFRCW